MTAMTVPVEVQMREEEGVNWYDTSSNGSNGVRYDAPWRSPQPIPIAIGSQQARKRRWEEAATPPPPPAVSDVSWDSFGSGQTPASHNGFVTPPTSSSLNGTAAGSGVGDDDEGDRDVEEIPRTKMQTGCIPCLIKGIRCDPSNPECKMAMSDDWALNVGVRRGEDEDDDDNGIRHTTANSASLTLFRPDLKWRRSWRERHCLNFFVNFSAPQMAGFFDSAFWQRMVIQTSYHEPAIRHAITAIGALHECIMQRAFANERQKAKAMEFALNQCNKAITCLTNDELEEFSNAAVPRRRIPGSRLALITCVLFTCFEAMQGRCDSAVNHALQGRRLLQATGRSDIVSMAHQENDDIEQMRPLVERLEVQATALLDKGRRPDFDTSDQPPPLPPIDYIYSLEHAHNTLHTALNSVMRFMQGFHPTAPKDHIAVTMAEKYLRYAPWFSQWESAFTSYLSDQRESMSNMDLKRAMVLKANHLVGTMLASVDQSAGPVAYDAYEAEFRAIVDLAREVLASFSCPPLPTLSGPHSGTPYLSFSLWVTDPLWMAISRCRNPTIRQSAFTLLSRNPRQEGIWHAGPQLPNSNQYMRRNDNSNRGSNENVRRAPACDCVSAGEGLKSYSLETATDVRTGDPSTPGSVITDITGQWTTLVRRINEWREEDLSQSAWLSRGGNQVRTERLNTYCTGRCSIPTMEELRLQRADTGYDDVLRANIQSTTQDCNSSTSEHRSTSGLVDG